jgi:hypothetical protein
MARAGKEFPLECPGRGGDMRLIAFITEPGPIQKVLTQVLLHTEWRTARASGESLPPAARPPAGENSSRSTFDRAIFFGDG